MRGGGRVLLEWLAVAVTIALTVVGWRWEIAALARCWHMLVAVVAAGPASVAVVVAGAASWLWLVSSVNEAAGAMLRELLRERRGPVLPASASRAQGRVLRLASRRIGRRLREAG